MSRDSGECSYGDINAGRGRPSFSNIDTRFLYNLASPRRAESPFGTHSAIQQQEREKALFDVHDDPTTPKTDQDRIHASDEDTRDARELPESSSSSRNYSERGWQGTSAQTFEALLRKAVQELRVGQYQNVKELEKSIYNVCTQNDKQEVFSGKSIDYAISLDKNIDEIFDANEELRDIKRKNIHGYVHFARKIKKPDNGNKGRYSLNIHPDRILDVVPRMIKEIITLPYIFDMKVSSDRDRANIRLDNIIVFFYNSADDKNKHELEQILRSYGEDTRLGHPAMMEPIEGIEGIAFADQNNAAIAKTGRARIQARHVAYAMWEQREEESTFVKLLSRVKERFRENGIDPDHPYRDLP